MCSCKPQILSLFGSHTHTGWEYVCILLMHEKKLRFFVRDRHSPLLNFPHSHCFQWRWSSDAGGMFSAPLGGQKWTSHDICQNTCNAIDMCVTKECMCSLHSWKKNSMVQTNEWRVFLVWNNPGSIERNAERHEGRVEGNNFGWKLSAYALTPYEWIVCCFLNMENVGLCRTLFRSVVLGSSGFSAKLFSVGEWSTCGS